MLNAHSTRALSHNSDIVGITAKCCNIVLYPFYSAKLVVKTVISALARLLFKFGEYHKAERSEAVVESDRDNALFRPYRNIKVLLVTASARISATVDINENTEIIPKGILGFINNSYFNV